MSYQIKTASQGDVQSLKALWQEVFNDDTEYINLFFENMFSTKNCIVAKSEKKVVGMLHFFESKLATGISNTEKSYYIYAVATKKEFRNLGIFKMLEAEVSRIAMENGISLLTLVPQGKQLFKFYNNFGYKTAFYRCKTLLAPQFSYNFSLIQCSEQKFLSLRSGMLESKRSYFDLNEKGQKYRYKILCSEVDVLVYQDNLDTGYIVAKSDGTDCYIFESDLPYFALCRAAYAIIKRMKGAKRVFVYGQSGKRSEYGMVKSLNDRISEFDIKNSNVYMNLMLDI